MPTLTDAIQRLSAQGERRNPQSELQQLWAKYKPEIVDYVNQLNAKAGEHNALLAESVRERQRGQGMGPATAQVLEDLAAGYNPSMMGVIKPKGGNWLAGSVEEAIKPLKTPLRRPDRVGSQAVTDEMWGEFLKDSPDAALNNWLETKLAKYIRNEMATPEDPVRALAERGVLHVDPEQLNFRSEMHGKYMSPGQTAVAQSPTAKAWEGAVDINVAPQRAGELLSGDAWLPDTSVYSNLVEKNPWLAKVPPETPVYSLATEQGRSSIGGDLGFSHLADELRNAINPESGLPADLLWKYSDLPKVTVPQAVERVAKINEWRAAQKVAADQARAQNAATVLHKEYPEKGFKWVELKAPEALPEGWSEAMKSKKTGRANMWYDENKAIQDKHPGEQALADALKYEGDTMGHCVGGYCPDVMEGHSRIFSLRDAKGQPHVTIEASPPIIEPRLSGDVEIPGRIVQIKGKQNRAPNPEYLPYVQDFVRSQPWSDVGDLANAGLYTSKSSADIARTLNTEYTPELASKLEQLDPTQYLTIDEIRALTKPAEGFAQGGIVESSNVNYNPERIDALVAQLKEELNG